MRNCISTHTPHARRDVIVSLFSNALRFQLTRLMRGVTFESCAIMQNVKFQLTRLMRGVTFERGRV